MKEESKPCCRCNYVKKLERRIHNQRVALRVDWSIREMRMGEGCGIRGNFVSRWRDYSLKMARKRGAIKS